MRVEDTTKNNNNNTYFTRGNASRKSKANNDEYIQNKNISYNNNNQPDYPYINNNENEAKYTFKLPNIPGPLGIHVIPTFDLTSQKDMGLVIQQIEPTGRIFKDGRLQIGDRIIEINNQCLIGIDFVSAQEILRDAMKHYELVFTVIRENNCFSSDSIEDNSFDRPIKPFNQHQINMSNEHYSDKSIDIEQHDGTDENIYYETKNYYNNNSNSNSANLNSLNTKKIGKRIHVQLVKGPQGLGFKLAARDNPTGEISPIYIKNILPKGAAIIDGRLQRGDRLLEVNGIDMTIINLHEAVEILREAKLGSLVDLVVSRQLNAFPREIPQNDQENNQTNDITVYRELLTYEIALNDTGSAGLGVSVKGKTKKNEEDDAMIDLGIFIKNVINGGAASKDGRLKPNDQLININGFSLLGKSNDEAMQILREAMLVETTPGYMELTVSRKRKQQQNTVDLLYNDNEISENIVNSSNNNQNGHSNNENQNHYHLKNIKSIYESNHNVNNEQQDSYNENGRIVEKINYNLLENEFIKNDKIFQRDRNYYYSLNHDKKRAFTREAASRRSMSEKRKQSSEAHDRVKVNKIADKSKIQLNKAAGSYESLLGSKTNGNEQQVPIYREIGNDMQVKSAPLKNKNHEKPPINTELYKNSQIKPLTSDQLFHHANQPNTQQNPSYRKSTSMESIPSSVDKQNSNLIKFQTKLQENNTNNNLINETTQKYVPPTFWRSFRNNINQTDSDYPLTNILNRRRTINRSFRKAVDKSFDVPTKELTDESNNNFTNEAQRTNYLRMSSKSDETKNGKKSKKSIIESFQNLFKPNKKNNEKYQKSNDFLRFHDINNQINQKT